MHAESTASLFTCQPGFEPILDEELRRRGFQPTESGRGWIVAGGTEPADLCFAHVRMQNAASVESTGVNAIAGQLLDLFLERMRGVQLPDQWPLIFRFADGITGLGQRTRSVEKEFRARLKKRGSRLERTADDDLPRGGGDTIGMFVFFTGFNRFFVATGAWCGGQRRMADDPAAPSRSYLKTEEAFVVMGREPCVGETVVDLGAAPGGWSYSAAKRGASVVAIDNGPLKGGALNHPLIEHRRDDAFKFMPANGETYDWLFCDLVEEPHHVVRLVEQWLKGEHCRAFVVNLKFGHANALNLLDEVVDPCGRLKPRCRDLRVRHLFHDRDEFTLTGHAAI